MKTYLITGGAGFIGANFVKHILSHHEEVQVVVLDHLTYAGNLATIASDIDEDKCYFIKGDIGDNQIVQSIFDRFKIDYVVNFAAESHVDRSIVDPQIFLKTNILGTQNLLDIAKQNWLVHDGDDAPMHYRPGVRFHQVSTDEVYGSLGATGLFSEQTPMQPHSPYSASKASADMIVQAYHDTYAMPTSITRCSNNYGPYHFPEKLIPLVIKNCLEGKSLPIYGDGSNVRDWLYVEDHCQAIDLVVRHGKEGEIYNVGGGNERTNLQIVKQIIATMRQLFEEDSTYLDILKKREIGTNGLPTFDWLNDNLITFVKDRLGHDKRYAIDATKLHEELGWSPLTSFDEGIYATVKWYFEHQEWVDNVVTGDYQKYYQEMYG